MSRAYDSRHGHGTVDRGRLGRSIRLTLASAVLPGSGLFPTSRRWLGAALLVVTGVPVVAALFWAWQHGMTRAALTLGTDRSHLRQLAVAAISIFSVWALGVLATAWTTRPERGTGAGKATLAGVTALCLGAGAIPTAAAVRTADLQVSVLNTVFAPSASGSSPSTASWSGRGRVNALLIGSDAGADREGIRSDSMIVASIDTKTGDTVLFSLPRNLERVPFPASNPMHAIFPDGYNCGSQCLLNGIWTLANDRPDLFPGDPNPGLTTLRDVIGEILDLPIDHTVVIDMAGFQGLVDAMGGVDITVKDRLCIGCKVNSNGQVVGTTGYIEPGFQHLDGYHALWFARSRAMSNDYDRMRRQRCMVGAIVDQARPFVLLAHYSQVADTLKADVSSDIPVDQLPQWADLVNRMKDATISSLAFTDSVVDVVHPDYPAIRAMVRDAIWPKAASATTSPTTAAPPSSSGTATPSPSPTPDDSLTDLSSAC